MRANKPIHYLMFAVLYFGLAIASFLLCVRDLRSGSGFDAMAMIGFTVFMAICSAAGVHRFFEARLEEQLDAEDLAIAKERYESTGPTQWLPAGTKRHTLDELRTLNRSKPPDSQS